jgi:23S rRNA (uracil1939-C5)-methyltransferase
MPKRPPQRPPAHRGRPTVTGALGSSRRERRPAPAAKPAATPLAGVDELELEIEKLIAGGDGLGRWQGVPIFVPRAAPGDRLRVQLVERRASFGRAEIVEILRPGPGRRSPPCPHFAVCGGCDLQHLDEPTQLRAKSEATLETLRRLSRMDIPAPREILAGAPFGYRLRTQVHLATDPAGIAVGYHARGSRRLVPVAACPILDPELERVVVGLGRELEPPVPSRVDLALGDGGEVAAAPPLPGLPGRELVRRVGELDYRFDARCFFQGHSGLLARFVDRVVGDAAGELAFDLYAGVGLFALPLARRYRRVVAVESDRIAARYARKNAQAARTGEVEVVARAVESWAPGGLVAGADRVVTDPPRDGLPQVMRRLLVARPPTRLTYVSCHAAALARDLADLAGTFAVESLVLVDLFPQTGHMESIVQLVRRSEP